MLRGGRSLAPPTALISPTPTQPPRPCPVLLLNQHVQTPAGPGGDKRWAAPRPPAWCTATSTRWGPRLPPPPRCCAAPRRQPRRPPGTAQTGEQGLRQRDFWRGQKPSSSAYGAGGGSRATAEAARPSGTAGSGLCLPEEKYPGGMQVAAGLPLHLQYMPRDTFLPTVLCFSHLSFRSPIGMFYYFRTVNSQRIFGLKEIRLLWFCQWRGPLLLRWDPRLVASLQRTPRFRDATREYKAIWAYFILGVCPFLGEDPGMKGL